MAVAAAYAGLDTLAEFPGAGELSLTRAIVQYRDAQVVDGVGCGVDDIGVALVVDGDYPAAAEALDLGSGRLRHLDLAAEVVILDWVYASSLDYVRMLMRAPAELLSGSTTDELTRPLRHYCRTLGLGVLARIGFGPLTRPGFLRLGFRDVVRDLDPNESAVVRVSIDSGDHLAVRLDCDHNALVVRRRRPVGDPELEALLAAAFAGADVRSIPSGSSTCFQLRFPLPSTLRDAHDLLAALRDGLLRLFAHYEPERFRATRHALDVFGPRDTLARLDRDAGHPALAPSFPAVAGVA